MLHSIKTWMHEWRGFLLLILLLSLFRSAVADWYTVPTGSMKPTVVEGDRIFVNKMAYGLRVPFTMLPLAGWDQPARGDIIVFTSTAADKRLVKRVIAIAGDTIALRDNQLFLNGRRADYNHSDIDRSKIEWRGQPAQPLLLRERSAGHSRTVAITRRYSNFGPVQVPEGHVFVLGDNRDFSADSRMIGFVPLDEILGQAHGIIVSLDPEHYYLPRSERFLMSF